MVKTLFEHAHYRTYLRSSLGPTDRRSGGKSKFAKAIGCQPGYLTQILKDEAHLSLEQAELANHHLGHTEPEAHYFLLLVQKDRAGTTGLRAYFEAQLQDQRNRHLEVSGRLGQAKELSDEHRARFYSSWIYAALHVALTVPELQTPQALASYFNLPAGKVAQTLSFFEQIGLAVRDGQKYIATKTVVRLARQHDEILKHHAHWRQQAIESLEREQPLDLHYSGAVSLSEADIPRVKDLLLEAIKNALEIIKPSEAESVHVMNMDFFRLEKRN